jgi:NSS family neurotransmitter:Na+ symporter
VKRDGFSGRSGLVLAALGMAIGTGNIWRFPRIAAKYEGGAFLIPWLLFLLTWSIPILIAEFTLGRESRRGPIGAFAKLLGKQAAWMGAFMAFTTLMIATYYSVVTGWVLKYLWISASSGFPELQAASDAASIQANHAAALSRFETFTTQTNQPLYYHLLATLAGLLVVWRGVRGGVELLCKVLVPSLFLILVAGTVWVFTSIDGAMVGLNYFFEPNWSLLEKPDIWMDALSQSAWSTGAGWGLVLAYGAVARRKEDGVVNNCTAAFGNNCASLLAGMFLFPAVFGLLGAAGMGAAEISGVLGDSGPASTGLAFQYVPFIFKSLPAHGELITTVFFASLFVAALSSLIAMYEMAVRLLMDLGLKRGKAVLVLAILCGGLGAPSALNMDFFITMDWVWSIGLVISGLMVVGAVQLYGIQPFREKLINSTADLKLSST